MAIPAQIAINGGRGLAGVAAGIVYQIPVTRLRSLLLRNEEAVGGKTLTIGTRGVTPTTGCTLQPGEAFGISHKDFKKDDDGDLVIYGVGSLADTVYSWFAVIV